MERAAEEPCRDCGGPLYRGDYPRKPRGGARRRGRGVRPPLQPVLRPRGMPPSRHAAVGSVPGPARVRRRRGDRGERGRAHDDGRERRRPSDGRAGAHDAPMAALVARARSRRPARSWSCRRAWCRPPSAARCPPSLLERLAVDSSAAVAKLLAWLAPITTASSPDGSRLAEGRDVAARAARGSRRRWRCPRFSRRRRVRRAAAAPRRGAGAPWPTTTTRRARACDGHVCAFKSSARSWRRPPTTASSRRASRSSPRAPGATRPPASPSASRSRPSSAGGTSRAPPTIRSPRSRARSPRTPARTRASAPRSPKRLRSSTATIRDGASSFTTTTCVALAREDPRLGPVPGYATVCRFMKEQGLAARPQAPPSRAARRRAVRRARDALVRGHPRPRPLAPGLPRGLAPRAPRRSGQWQKPQLLGVLDDRSRLCCHLQWYLDETAEALIHALSQAFQKRGLPRALLTDNGAAMLAAETVEGLERLGIVHHTTLPYSPEQNGKQESFWGQIEGRLLPMLEGEPRPHARPPQHRHPGLGRAGIPAQGPLRDPRVSARALPARAERRPREPKLRRPAPRVPDRGLAQTATQRRHRHRRGRSLRSPLRLPHPPAAAAARRALGSLQRRPRRPALGRAPRHAPAARQGAQRRARSARRRARRLRASRTARRHRPASARAHGRLRRHRTAPCLPAQARPRRRAPRGLS